MRLHILTDTRIQQQYSHYQQAEMAFLGGAPVLQYRNKDFVPNRDLPELQAIAALARKLNRILIVNDDPNLALEVGAQGVHLGQADGSIQVARQILGGKALIGATVHDLNELEALRGKSVDYIGAGPVFGTKSKATGLPDLGLEALAEICRVSPFPVIGIGSISLENAALVQQAGADGVAIISAFCLAKSPQKSVEEFIKILD